MQVTETTETLNSSRYRRSTYDSLNPLIRFAHRSRLQKALGLVNAKSGYNVLDYGCGDAHF
jgi:hypothetical protein